MYRGWPVGDFLAFDDKLERARLMSQLDIEPQNLSDPEVDQLLAFLQSLTGTESIKGRLGRPETVPSGPPCGLTESFDPA